MFCAVTSCRKLCAGGAGEISSAGELISANRQKIMDEIRTATDTIILERKSVACKIPIASQNLRTLKPSSVQRVTRQKVVRSCKQRPAKYIEE